MTPWRVLAPTWLGAAGWSIAHCGSQVVVDAGAGGARTEMSAMVSSAAPEASSAMALTTSTGTPCTPKSCAELGVNCGQLDDGCGKVLDCGACTPPETCGGGGTAHVCGKKCLPTTCQAHGWNCGNPPDGCGGTLECGTCSLCDPKCCFGNGDYTGCGFGGEAFKCGCSTGLCFLTCKDYGPAACGTIYTGCVNGLVDCGTCTPPQTCGGGGKEHLCGP